MLRARQARLDDERDHLLEIVDPQRLPAPDPPQVELVRRPGVEPIDRVAPVHETRTRDQDVIQSFSGETLEDGRDHRGRHRPQQQPLAHVARVPRVARRTVGRIVQAIVVVFDRDHGIGAVCDQRAPPTIHQGSGDRADQELKRVRPQGRVGQVTERDRPAVVLDGDRLVGHGSLAVASDGSTSRSNPRTGRVPRGSCRGRSTPGAARCPAARSGSGGG